MSLCATSDKQFQTLCGVIGRSDLASDPALATNAQRVALRPQLLKALGETMATLDKAELSAKLEAAGLPYAPITRPDQLVDDPHLLQSGGMVTMACDDGSTTQSILLPLTLGGRRLGVRKPLPKIGEDTEAVLASLAPTTTKETTR